MKSLSRVQRFATPWTVAYQAPQSMESSRQEYWSGLPFPSLGYLPNPGIEPASPALAGGFFTTEPPEKPSPLLAFTTSLTSDNKQHWACFNQRSSLETRDMKPKRLLTNIVSNVFLIVTFIYTHAHTCVIYTICHVL